MNQKELLQIAVCDDDLQVAKEISDMSAALPYCGKCWIFSESEELLTEVNTGGEVFDAVLLDIEWDGMERGIETAKKLLQISPRTGIIYVTGYTQKYVQEVFLSGANLKGFLTKPVDPVILDRNLRQIYEGKKKVINKFFTFTENRTKQVVYFDEIYYLESRGHRIAIYTVGRKYECYGKLNDMSARFPDNFIQCHKSYLVNMDYIDRIQTKERFFVLKDGTGTHIPISKLCYAVARKRFYEYKMNRFGEGGEEK